MSPVGKSKHLHQDKPGISERLLCIDKVAAHNIKKPRQFKAWHNSVEHLPFRHRPESIPLYKILKSQALAHTFRLHIFMSKTEHGTH